MLINLTNVVLNQENVINFTSNGELHKRLNEILESKDTAKQKCKDLLSIVNAYNLINNTEITGIIINDPTLLVVASKYYSKLTLNTLIQEKVNKEHKVTCLQYVVVQLELE